MPFDTEALIDQWACGTPLSRRKIAFLEHQHERTLETMRDVVSYDIATNVLCDALDLPDGSYWCQCVAALLDQVKPDPHCVRLLFLNAELLDHGLMKKEVVA